MSHRFAVFGVWASMAGTLAGLLVAAASQPAAAAATGKTNNASPASLAARSAAPGKVVSLEGEMQVEVADYPDHTSRVFHVLHTPGGERILVKFKGNGPAHLVTGSKVRIKGVLADSTLAPAEGDPLAVQQMAPAMPYAVGDQKTAVILVSFQDNPIQPQTLATVQNLVFGQVNNFYLENSFQTTSVSGKVFGWYTIPVSQTSCDIGAIKSYGRSAATAAGADLSPYTRFVYVFPNTSACSWAGYGTIGGSPTDAWINGYFDRRVIAHELGHNLGLRHAHSLNCGGAAIGSSCTSSEYGDLIDTMGWGLYGHFSAYQKELLGWLNYNGMPPVTTVQSSGTYTIAPYASAGNGAAKALKVLKSTDSTTGMKTWYYLEYRQPLGFDASLAGVGNLTSGVSIRTANSSTGVSLLDMTPNSDLSSDYNDNKDSALTVGRTFTDTAAQASFTVTRADSTGATVNVVLGGTTAQPTCTRAQPAVVLSSSQGTTVAAGTPVSYTVAVTNNDSSACGSSTFNLAKTVPSGWTGNLGSGTLTLGAGSTASTTLTVISPITAVAGTYSLSASAANGSGGLAGSGSASYVVGSTSSTTVLAPVAVNDSATVTAGTPAKIAVKANDYDPAGRALTLVKADPAGKGTVTANADGTVTYTANAGVTGWDGFTYTISNGTKTAWASVAVQIKAPTVTDSGSTTTGSTGTTTTVQAPVAVNDSVTGIAGTPVKVAVKANDYDPAGRPLTLIKVDPPGKGTATINADGTVTYTPATGATGWDGFTYTISNGEKTAWASVAVQMK